jgi:lipopolysaccharide/colanic/teichoic acid biosynthesis glycosyltransferase
MLAKRLFDIFFASIGLAVSAPAFAVIALLVKLGSKGPVFFRQTRVGRYGRPFRIFKFRTMCVDAEAKGAEITVGDDKRITRAGRVLRKYKLDELPQLINVLKGEMSMVGPRPEVPRYVEHYPPKVRNTVLSVPPGITDYASIEFKDESSILGASRNPEAEYVKRVLPIKLKYYERYVSERSVWVDLKLVLATIKEVLL